MNPSWVLSEDQRKKRFKKYRDTGGEAGDDNDMSPGNSQDSESEMSGGMNISRNRNR